MHPYVSTSITNAMAELAAVEASQEAISQVLTVLSVRCTNVRLSMSQSTSTACPDGHGETWISAHCTAGEALGEVEAALAMLGVSFASSQDNYRHYRAIPGTDCAVMIRVEARREAGREYHENGTVVIEYEDGGVETYPPGCTHLVPNPV